MSRAQKRRSESDSEKKEKYNSTISLAIAEIVRFSTDDEFRSKCFQFMKVNNTNHFQQAIKNKLDSLISLHSKEKGLHTLPKRANFDNISNAGAEMKYENSVLPGPSCLKETTHVDTEEETDGTRNNIQNSTIDVASLDSNEISFNDPIKTFDVSNMPNPRTDGHFKENILCTPKKTNSSSDPEEQQNKVIQSKTDPVKNDSVDVMKNDFWPTEQCCLWDLNLLQEEMSDFNLNENDTDWK